MVDFISIDFETANCYLSSACSVGICIVENSIVNKSFASLIKPQPAQFEETNIQVHGITPDMVAGAPTMLDLWPKISEYFSEHIPVVAHNAHFDMSVLNQSLPLQIPNFLYVDTMVLARPYVSGSRSLASCCDAFSIDLTNHHDAASDSEACARVAIECMRKSGCLTFWEYLAKQPDTASHFYHDLIPQTKLSKAPPHRRFPHAVKPSDVYVTVDSIPQDSPLCGKNIVFTGELTTMSRTHAMQSAVNRGATVKSSVSRKTDFLVVGVQDKNLVGDDGMSTKEEYAYKLNSEGKASIKFLTEQEYLALLGNEVLV